MLIDKANGLAETLDRPEGGNEVETTQSNVKRRTFDPGTAPKGRRFLPSPLFGLPSDPYVNPD
jgi:hypothetical protein